MCTTMVRILCIMVRFYTLIYLLRVQARGWQYPDMANVCIVSYYNRK